MKLEGFRGAKKPLELNFSNHIILAGHSGSGKTSILQAIEWGLFGKILGFKGYGFTDEDAYVNMFSGESKATVELDLILPEEKTLFIRRNRKKARKSTVGRTNLEVWFKGEEHKGKEAQNLIEDILDLDHEKFTQAVFLHQDMIRKFVEGGPKDRSEIIDQLLGLKNLREFTEGLDPKRKIRKEIKILQEIKKSLEEQKKAIEIESQERLDQQERALIKEGYEKKELNFEYLGSLKNSLIPKLEVILKEYNLEPIIDKFKITDTKTAQIFRKHMESSLLAVERARSKQISKYQTQKIQIQETLKQLDQARTKIKGQSIKKLKQNTLILEQEIKTQESQKEYQLKIVDNIDPILSDYNYLHPSYMRKKVKLEKLVKDSGEYPDLIAEKNENLKEIDRLENEIKKEDSLTHIFSSAYLFITENKSSNCPVCKQEIDPRTVLKELETQNKATGERIILNKKKIEELKKENKRIFSALSKLEEIQRQIDLLNEEMTKKIQRLREYTGVNNITIQKANMLLKESRKKIRELEVEIQEKKLEKRKNEQEIKEHEETNKMIKELEDNLKKLIPSLSSEDSSSLDESARLYLEELESKINQLQETGGIDSVRNNVERIEPIIDYLSKLEDFEQRMGEKSKIDEKIDVLSYKIVKLDDLETSLQTIREIVSEHQNELTNKSLEDFQSSINDYYGKIIGHPIFKKVRIKPIAGEPVSYDLLAYNDEADLETHVNTRFSTAQANATALSLFFAINQKLAVNLPLLILDDPTQNMDPIFQTALVETLESLAVNRQLLIATHENQFANKIVEKLKPEIDLIQMDEWTIEGPNLKKIVL